MPVLFALIAVFNRKIAAVATEVRERESRVYSLVQWAMSSIKVVQAFTKEEEEHRRFMGASRDEPRARRCSLYTWQTLYSGAVNALIAAGTALVVYAGAARGARRAACRSASWSCSSPTWRSSTRRSTRSPRAGA